MKRINIKLVLKIIFSFSLLFFLFLKLDISVLLNLNRVVFVYILIAILITCVSLFVMSYRYQLLISYFLKKSVDVIIIYKYYLIGSFFNIFLPGAIGGDAVRVKKLVSNHGVNYKNSAAITIGERLTGLYGLLVLLSISLFFQNFPSGFDFESYVPKAILKASPFVIILMLPILTFTLNRFKIKVTYLFAFKTVLVILLAQMGDILIAYLFSNFLGLNISFVSYIFIMPIVYISTILPISLGGLGVREGVFSGLLTLYGIDASIAITISLLMYFTKIIVGLVGYVVYLKDK